MVLCVGCRCQFQLKMMMPGPFGRDPRGKLEDHKAMEWIPFLLVRKRGSFTIVQIGPVYSNNVVSLSKNTRIDLIWTNQPPKSASCYMRRR